MPSKKQRRKNKRNCRINRNKQASYQTLCRDMIQNDFRAKNEKQKILYDAIFDNSMTIAYGSAGSGKSYIGVETALELLLCKMVKRIIITRNPVSTGQSMGYFPGSAAAKLELWLLPIITHIKRRIGIPLYEMLLQQGKIQLYPMEVLKGVDFTKSFVIVEEAQECSMEQLKMITTRIGKRSKLFLNGDLDQSNSKVRGDAFKLFIHAIKSINQYTMEQIDICNDLDEWEKIIIPIIEFTDEDCVRSWLTQKMLYIFSTTDI